MEVSLQAGRVVGEHWRLRGRLGVEGTSRFWEAEELHTGGHVVIEFSSADLADPAAKLWFSRETRVLTSFRSSHVVRTLHRGLVREDLAFAVTELLRGEDLSRLLARESALELTEVAQILDQACRGISRLDAVRIAHRVLEPKHVFLVADRANARIVKLLNVGLGRGNTRASNSVSPYVSPERVSVAPQVWAIGVMAYRMLSGGLPFITDDQKTRNADWLARFAHLREGRTDLPRELDEWFQTALHPDPGQRFATVEQAGLAFGHIASTYAGRAARLRRLMEPTSPKPPPLPSTSPSTPAVTASEHAGVGEQNPPDATAHERMAVEQARVAPTPSEHAAAVDAASEYSIVVEWEPSAVTLREPTASVESDPPATTVREYTASVEWDPVDATPSECAASVEWDSADATPSERAPVIAVAEDAATTAHADAAAPEPDQAGVTDRRRAAVDEPAVGHERSMDVEQDWNAAGAHERTTVASRVHASAKRRKRVAASERAASLARDVEATERLSCAASVGIDRAIASNPVRTVERPSIDTTPSQEDERDTRPTLEREHLAIVVRDAPAAGEHATAWDQNPSASLTFRGHAPAVRVERDAGTASGRPTLVRQHVGRSDSSAAERARTLRAERDRWRVSAAVAVLLGLLAGFALRSVVSNQHRSASREQTAAEEGISAHSIIEMSPQPTAAVPRASAPAAIEPAASPTPDSQPIAHPRSGPSKRSAASAVASVSRAVTEGSSPEFVTPLPAAPSVRGLGHETSARSDALQPTEAPSDELLDPANPQRVSTLMLSPLIPAPITAAARPAPPPTAARPPDATPLQVYRGF
jgi:serine/threonine protein kinase